MPPDRVCLVVGAKAYGSFKFRTMKSHRRDGNISVAAIELTRDHDRHLTVNRCSSPYILLNG